jgi:hypothetical protein
VKQTNGEIKMNSTASWNASKTGIDVMTKLIGYRPENDLTRFRILSIMSNDGIIPDLLFESMVKSHVAMLQNCINWERIEEIEQKDFLSLKYETAFDCILDEWS